MKTSKIKNWLYGLEAVLSNRNYIFLFIIVTIIFSVLYIFEWNLILFPNFYIRTDLWTMPNILSLAIISVLSSMAIILGIFNLKMKMIAGKGGFFAIIPTFFVSACSGCAPFLLSFTSTSFAIGLSLAKFGTIIKIFSILVLLATILYMSSTLYRCKINLKNRGF